MNRLAIYVALGVPEVWRWDGRRLRVCLVQDDGSYKVVKQSQAFPFLLLAPFAAFLTKKGVSETGIIKAFRAWVREQRARGWKTKRTK